MTLSPFFQRIGCKDRDLTISFGVTKPSGRTRWHCARILQLIRLILFQVFFTHSSALGGRVLPYMSDSARVNIARLFAMGAGRSLEQWKIPVAAV